MSKSTTATKTTEKPKRTTRRDPKPEKVEAPIPLRPAVAAAPTPAPFLTPFEGPICPPLRAPLFAHDASDPSVGEALADRVMFADGERVTPGDIAMQLLGGETRRHFLSGFVNRTRHEFEVLRLAASSDEEDSEGAIAAMLNSMRDRAELATRLDERWSAAQRNEMDDAIPPAPETAAAALLELPDVIAGDPRRTLFRILQRLDVEVFAFDPAVYGSNFRRETFRAFETGFLPRPRVPGGPSLPAATIRGDDTPEEQLESLAWIAAVALATREGFHKVTGHTWETAVAGAILRSLGVEPIVAVETKGAA